jgi:hypothetical protein
MITVKFLHLSRYPNRGHIQPCDFTADSHSVSGRRADSYASDGLLKVVWAEANCKKNTVSNRGRKVFIVENLDLKPVFS